MTDQSSLPAVHLRRGRDRSVRLGHPWLMSGSIARVEGAPEPGDTVRVCAEGGEVLGAGDYDPDSQIRVRLHTTGGDAAPPDEPWLDERIEAALAWRASHPDLQETDALRLIHAEGDGLPGLTVDRYADWLSVRLGTPGMARRAERIAEILVERTGAKGAWLRGAMAGAEALERALFGDVPETPVEILEHGRRYRVDLRLGQKTGFYLDQRDARDRFARLAQGRRALDLFSYTGGFAAAAVQGGAERVVAVESSPPACALLLANAPEAERVQGDVRDFLDGDESRFDLVAIDPPPFARRRRDVQAATRAYKDLHLRLLRRVEPGAFVLTFTCSHHVGADLFRKVVFSAVADAGAQAQVLATLGAPPDHPVDIRHPQGEYLNGLLLRIASPAA